MTVERDFKQQALTVLRDLIDAATQAGDFIRDQIPLVVRELLVYNTVKYALMTCVCAGLLTGSVFWIRHCFKKHEDPFDDWDMATIPGWIAGAMSLFGFIGFAMSLLKITLAPRVWLMEYAAGLMR